jgi:holo-[acyl-carrier protein] synthase
MNIVGIGTDIVECLRIRRMIEQHGELFLTRVYTEREIRYCQSRKHATEHFAGRWAAKEAILKCLGTGWRRGLCWTDMEVRNDPDGRPRVHVCGAAKDLTESLHIADILISMSHCRAYATAYALAIRKPLRATAAKPPSPPTPGAGPAES